MDRVTRAKQIEQRFAAFHTANPRVWQLFCRFCAELTAAGRTRYSVDAVVQRIRWHVDIETHGEEVKINDHYRAYYARMWMATHPGVKLFELRRRTSEARSAYETDVAVFNTGAPECEAALMQRLTQLAGGAA